jgi:hypothetical protein
LVDDHDSADDWPFWIDAGLAENDKLGAAFTVTVAVADAEPPAPVQVSLYVAFAVGYTTVEPVIAFEPLQLPEAEQPDALVDDHFTVLP